MSDDLQQPHAGRFVDSITTSGTEKTMSDTPTVEQLKRLREALPGNPLTTYDSDDSLFALTPSRDFYKDGKPVDVNLFQIHVRADNRLIDRATVAAIRDYIAAAWNAVTLCETLEREKRELVEALEKVLIYRVEHKSTCDTGDRICHCGMISTLVDARKLLAKHKDPQ